MKTFTTEVNAHNTQTGEMELYAGPHIKHESWEDAEQWCKKNAPYLKVTGKLITDDEEPKKESKFLTWEEYKIKKRWEDENPLNFL